MSRKSEFGRGYAVCLRQFLFHKAELPRYLSTYERLRTERPDPRFPDLWNETSAVEIWANGAADHLIDIARPRRWVTRDEWTRAKALSDLVYGAGRQWGDRTYTAAEMRAALREAEALLHAYGHAAGMPVPLTFQEAWDLDVAAGITPLRGDAATCEEPLRGRP